MSLDCYRYYPPRLAFAILQVVKLSIFGILLTMLDREFLCIIKIIWLTRLLEQIFSSDRLINFSLGFPAFYEHIEFSR